MVADAVAFNSGLDAFSASRLSQEISAEAAYHSRTVSGSYSSESLHFDTSEGGQVQTGDLIVTGIEATILKNSLRNGGNLAESSSLTNATLNEVEFGSREQFYARIALGDSYSVPSLGVPGTSLVFVDDVSSSMNRYPSNSNTVRTQTDTTTPSVAALGPVPLQPPNDEVVLHTEASLAAIATELKVHYEKLTREFGL